MSQTRSDSALVNELSKAETDGESAVSKEGAAGMFLFKRSRGITYLAMSFGTHGS